MVNAVVTHVERGTCLSSMLYNTCAKALAM